MNEDSNKKDGTLQQLLIEALGPDPLRDDEIEQLLEAEYLDVADDAQLGRIIENARDLIQQSLSSGPVRPGNDTANANTSRSASEVVMKRVWQETQRSPKRRNPRGAVAALTVSIMSLVAVLFWTSEESLRREAVVAQQATEKQQQIADIRQHWLTARALPSAEVQRVRIGDIVQTGQRERRRVNLPDGSVLYVNESAIVKVATARRVEVECGEVFVEVVPQFDDEQRRELFEVVTPTRTITALGTKFGVDADDSGTDVLVTQGKVRVSGIDRIVEAGQQLAVATASTTLRPAVRASEHLGWTRDLMVAAAGALVPTSEYVGGAIISIDPGGQKTKLSLRKYHVDVHIEDGFARTTIDQTYFNHTQSRLEGTFHFPLPPDASLSRLAMYVNGKLMEGGMAEREHARNTFEKIVHKMKDPALLEWVDGSTFKMRVFPLEARQEKRIVLSYTQRLNSAYGKTYYRFPSGHSRDVVRDWSTKIRVKKSVDEAWKSPSHELNMSQDGDDLVLVDEEHNSRMNRDLVLELGDGESPSSHAAQWARHVYEGHQYLMLRLRPELPGKMKRVPRHWVCLFESSADRNPVLARTQIEVIRTLLENAEHSDTFNIVTANTEAMALAKKPLTCSAKNINNAMSWLEQTHLIGALDLQKALGKCTEVCQSPHQTVVVHTGSAIPVLGEQDQSLLLQRIPDNASYVGVGVGRRWSRPFMKEAAGTSGGYFTQINPDEEIGWCAFELASVLNTPRLLNVRVADASRPDEQSDVSGEHAFLNFADTIVQGEEIATVARFPVAKKLPKSVIVSGLLNGKPWQQSVKVKRSAGSAEHLPRSWAKLQIDRLIADSAAEHKSEIIRLSKSMYVMSPFTSLLVLENEEMYTQHNIDRGRKDHWALYPCPQDIKVVHEPVSVANNSLTQNLSDNESDWQRHVRILSTPPLVSWPNHVIFTGGVSYPTVDKYFRPIEYYKFYSGNQFEESGPVRRVESGLDNAWEESLLQRLQAPAFISSGQNRVKDQQDLILLKGNAADVKRVEQTISAMEGADRSLDDVNLQELIGRSRGRFQVENIALRQLPSQDVERLLREQLEIAAPDVGTELGDGSVRFLTDDLKQLSYNMPELSYSAGGRRGLSVLNGQDGYAIGRPIDSGGLPAWNFSTSQSNGTVYFGDTGLFDHWGVQRYDVPLMSSLDLVGDDQLNITRNNLGWSRLPLTWDDGHGDLDFGRTSRRSLKFASGGQQSSSSRHRWGGQIQRHAVSPLVSLPSFGNVVQPQFGNDPRYFCELMAHAPGLNTSRADVWALAAANQAEPDKSRKPGRIDEAARKLIDRARSRGWEKVTYPAAEGQEAFSLLCDGAGRYAYNRIISEGLREQVTCDGRMLTHAYPDIGLAAERTYSRFHRRHIESVVPWLLPDVAELARGANVVAVDERTVAVVPKLTGQSEQENSAQPALKKLETHFVFDDHGRLTERRLIASASQKIVLRTVFDADGTVRLLDGDKTERSVVHLKRAAADQPSLKTKMSELVILPMPIRSSESVLKQHTDSDGTLDLRAWSKKQLLALVLGDLAEGNGTRMVKTINDHFFEHNDRRDGLYVLLSRFPNQLVWEEDLAESDGRKRQIDLRPSPEGSPLRQFVRQSLRWQQDPNTAAEFAIEGPQDGFVRRMAQSANFYQQWKSGAATQDRTKSQIKTELIKALKFVASCQSDTMGWTLLSVMMPGIEAADLNAMLADAAARFEDNAQLAAVVRQERVRALFRAQRYGKARRLYSEMLRNFVRQGLLPRIATDIRKEFVGHGGRDAWSDLVSECGSRLTKVNTLQTALQFSIQLRQLGDTTEANLILEAVLMKMSAAEQPDVALLAVEQLRQLADGKANALMDSVLSVEQLKKSPQLFRYAAQVADDLDRKQTALQRLEQAVLLEFANRPEVINVERLRNDYTELLTRFEQVIDAAQTLETQQPDDLFARIIRAADQWRSLEDDTTMCCHTTARILTKLNRRDLAWRYLTTPLAGRSGESAPWSKLAETLSNQKQVDLADVAWAKAFEFEQTNPGILLSHAKMLAENGRPAASRKLLKQIVDSSWQPRFRNLQQEARNLMP